VGSAADQLPAASSFDGVFCLMQGKMAPKKTSKPPFDLKVLLCKANGGKKNARYGTNTPNFVQGDKADAIFYIKEGKVKLTVLSKQGKEAVVAILKEGDFFGEGCLAGQPLRMATAIAISECSIMKIEKAKVVGLLHEEPSFSEFFVAHLLSRNIKIGKISLTNCSTLARSGWHGSL
jgi:CRP/FNR family cyclic AMP-dependent transcriptional regulator